jgi:hypothetical protein
LKPKVNSSRGCPYETVPVHTTAPSIHTFEEPPLKAATMTCGLRSAGTLVGMFVSMSMLK